jgi:hypothetical protein
MSTINEKITFKGKLRWASVPPNTARKPFEIDDNEPENCSYSIEVECSKAQFDELLKKGIPRLTTLRDSEDGTTYIRLKSSKIKGKYTFPDPAVIDIKGNKLESKIANGSEGVVLVELAPIKGRKVTALRLKSVMVTNLITFDTTDTSISDLLALADEQATSHSQDVTTDTGDW